MCWIVDTITLCTIALPADDIAGVRIGHHLDVHVGSFGIQPIAK